MSLSQLAVSFCSAARLCLVPVVFASLVSSACASEDDDEDEGGGSSSAMEQRVLLEVAVKVQPDVALLNGEDDRLVTPERGVVAEQSGAEDPLAAIANGAPVELGSSSGSDSGSDADDE